MCLRPERWLREAPTTVACLWGEGGHFGHYRQEQQGRPLQTHQYHLVHVPHSRRSLRGGGVIRGTFYGVSSFHWGREVRSGPSPGVCFATPHKNTHTHTHVPHGWIRPAARVYAVVFAATAHSVITTRMHYIPCIQEVYDKYPICIQEVSCMKHKV